MNYKYAYRLLDNARAFLESAVDYARKDERDQWNFAILHLASALELLLKARLAIADPKLLVAGNAKVNDRSFERGDFRSVGIDEAIERLGRTSQFSLSKRQRNVFGTLRCMRNRIVHYIDSTDTSEIKAVVGACLNLFIEINNAEFQDEDPYRAKTILQVTEELNAFDDFVKDRLDYLSQQLHSSLRPRTRHLDECSRCLQDATIIVDDNIQCLFCGDRLSIQEFAELISEDGSVEICPACGRQAVAKHQWGDREPTHECFCCGYFRGPELKWCDYDGSKIPRLSEIPRLKDVT